MPLLLLCGYPCSGKSVISSALSDNLNERLPNCEIVIIKEYEIAMSILSVDKTTEKFDPRTKIYANRDLEKQLRAQIKSETERCLVRTKPTNILVIVDANNYIKGYRYEMHCVAKSTRHQQAILQCTTDVNACRKTNTETGRYPETLFDDLVSRFEIPNPSSRWDSPLYQISLPPINESLQSDSNLLSSIETIADRLIAELLTTGVKVRPNQSTVPAKTLTGNFLQVVDQVTNQVIKTILEAQQTGEEFATLPKEMQDVSFDGKPCLPLSETKRWTACTLAKAKHQFLAFIRSNPQNMIHAKTDQSTNNVEVATLFLHFLKNEAHKSSFLT